MSFKRKAVLKTGFTLLEVLISALILVLVFSSSLMLLKYCFQGVANVTEFTSSVYLVQSKMEELRPRSFDDLVLIGEESFDGGKGLLKVSKVTGDLALVEIKYDWDLKKAPIRVATFTSRY